MREELKVSDEYEVIVPKQDHFGKGIVKIKNMFVFIKEALPGDVCKIEITNVKKTFATARIKKLITPSQDRQLPLCPYYEFCGGCHIMHEKYQKQLEFKEMKVKELLERFTGLQEINIFPIVAKNDFYYRNKVIFHGDGKTLGFYQETTHQIVPIQSCMITNQKINDVYQKIQLFLNENVEAIIEHLMIRITSLEEILVVLEGKINKEEFLSYLGNNITVYINNQLVQGKPYIVENIFGMKFHIYPSSFFQVNYEMMLVLYRIVMNYYQNKDYYQVLDLYCGTGTIGMLVSPYVDHVIGVEQEKSSIQSANLCKKMNDISNVTFIEGKVEDKIDSFKDIDSIIVDPPRSGLDNHTIEIILELLPRSITYISCDPVTLARDLKMLLNDYEVVEVHPVDMFPNTYHVETVVFLERISKRVFTNYTILVNKDYPYEESDFDGMVLVKTNDIEGKEVFVEEITYSHYLKFKDALKKMGIEVSITSGYRSLQEQKYTITELKDVYQENQLYEKVAPVGCSEHHTGLALDITISDKNQYQHRLTDYYPEEELKIREQKYELMAKICSEYGFILRYPKNKTNITGYAYEPWHFRYVGMKAAKVIMDNNITLEEYLDKA